MNVAKYKKEIRELVIARDKRTCRYCGKSKLYGTQLNLDHVLPESQGGAFSVDNLVVACKQCNHRKGARSVEVYVAYRLAVLAREQATLQNILLEINS